jgi:alpha-L-fucosidase
MTYLLISIVFVVLGLLFARPARAQNPAAKDEDAKFQPTWPSLKQYQCPEWFRDAKFGIYVHWGPYSATGGSDNTDWYSRNMYVRDHANHAEHLKNHGPVDTFGYKDAEHAGGFAMWDSQVTPWNAQAMGPKRDVVAEMEKAVRKRGLKFLTSFHHHWKWGWYPTEDTRTDCSDPACAALYGPPLPPSAWATTGPDGKPDVMKPDPRPDAAFNKEWLDKVKEVLTGYEPDLIWFDNRMEILTEETRMEMAAFYYNQAQASRRPVVMTYKPPDMQEGTGTIDLERARMADIYPDPWLTDTSVARSSWSYAAEMEYYTVKRLIDDLVDIVSKNGCLLLNIAPAPDGTIPEEQQQQLRAMGAWLRMNGEAIYGTRPWKIFGQGPTQTPVGHLSDLEFHGFTHEDIRFTRSKDGQNLYVFALGWPESGKVVIPPLAAPDNNVTNVTMLGHEGELTWQQNADALEVILPERAQSEYALTLKVTGQQWAGPH